MAATGKVTDDELRAVFATACALQDADQCESHSTGDDCQAGEVESALFDLLATIRVRIKENSEAVLSRLRIGVPSSRDHTLNHADDCVSWCAACRENTSRGLNPDGTAKS